jgi:co-chaperonin GroES (HSP10)
MDFKKISSENFAPMQNFIVIKPSSDMEGKKEEETTESGLILTLAKEKSVVNDRPTNGVVLSCGPECTIVKPGMEIFWDITRGLDIEFKNGFHMMVSEENIIGYRLSDEK